MSEQSRTEIVRECFRAYELRERDLAEKHLADDFEFYAPPDPGIDRDTYFERRRPNASHLKSFDFVRLSEVGDEVAGDGRGNQGGRQPLSQHRNPHLRGRQGRKGRGVLRVGLGLICP